MNEQNPILKTSHTRQLIEEYARLGSAQELSALPHREQDHIRMGVLANEIKTQLTERHGFTEEQIMDALRTLRQKGTPQQDPEKSQ